LKPSAQRIFAIILASAICTAAPAGAQTEFAGVPLLPTVSSYIVLKDANVRAEPKTSAKRLGHAEKGERLTAIGRTKDDDWIAIERDGVPFGFIYARLLAATIDGSLQDDLTGTAEVSDDRSCNYRIHFDGKSKAAGGTLVTSDYQVALRCTVGHQESAVDATMFITEIPYVATRRDVFQVNVDIPQIPESVEQVLSVITMYHADKQEVVFDAISDETMASKAPIKTQSAASVPEALTGALTIAVSAWGKKVWTALGKAKAGAVSPE
jgi:hypothetical protein